MLNSYIILAISIFAEICATTMIKASAGLTKLVPSVVVIIGYSISFYGLSQVIKTINIGIAYAFWAGLGIVLVSLLSLLLYKQHLDVPAILGIAFIVIGVIIIQLFSKSVSH